MVTKYPQPNIFEATCTSHLMLELLADKWTVLVITALEPGTQRFSQLQRRIGGISQKMLTQTLRKLERDGLVERTVYPAVPPMVEYTLTDLGGTLIEPMNSLRNWIDQHYAEVKQAREKYE